MYFIESVYQSKVCGHFFKLTKKELSNIINCIIVTGKLVEMKTVAGYVPEVISDSDLSIKRKDSLKQGIDLVYDYMAKNIKILQSICENFESKDQMKALALMLSKPFDEMVKLNLMKESKSIDTSSMTDEELGEEYMKILNDIGFKKVG